VIPLLIGLAVGLVSARIVWGWTSLVPFEERMTRVLAVSTPVDAQNFVRLLADKTVMAQTRMTDGCGYEIAGWQIKMTVSGVRVESPLRPTISECLQDVPRFQAQVEALRAVK
jgi:hypothetical protein